MSNKINNIAEKCYEIQASLNGKQVPEFEAISEIGMSVRLALHLRGLPLIKYDTLKLVAAHYLNIGSIELKVIIKILAEIEFIRIDSEGDTIKSILPTVPYFDDMYDTVNEFAETEKKISEPELVAMTILDKLTNSPLYRSSLYEMGAEKNIVDRNLQIGKEGGYILDKRARGKDIVVSPIFFSENVDIYMDLVAKAGAGQTKHLLELIKKSQGWPLSIIEKQKEINGTPVTDEEIMMLKRLAQDGAVKPPCITTSHHGDNYFMFTPTPGKVKLSSSKREIYERAMAIVASVRQGQLLPAQYRIKSPIRLLSALRDRGFLRANTEAVEQYRKLTVLRVGRLVENGYQWYEFRLNEAKENVEALDLAISMIQQGDFSGMEIDDNIKIALQSNQDYIESIIATQKLRESDVVSLSEEQKEEVDNILLGGVGNN